MPDSTFYDQTEDTGENSFDLGHYFNLVLKYRWLLIIPFCLAMAAGTYLAITLPREYEAQTLILVESQKVPSEYVRSIVPEDINSRISTISQQIKSRTRLTKIIDQFNLFSGPGYEKMYIDDKVNMIRKRIGVEVSRHRNAADSFTISFRWKDPEIVAKVVNAVTSYFIDENLKARESYATGTKDFLGDELDQMKIRLEGFEKVLKDYRGKYMGELPEQLDSNLSMLDRLQENMSEKQQTLRDARNRLALIEARINDAKTVVLPEMAVRAPVDPSEPLSSQQPASIDQLKRMLADLKLRYTDQHPDVVRLKKMIAEKEKGGVPAIMPDDASADNTMSPSGTIADIQRQRMLSEMEFQALSLKNEISETGREINQSARQIKLYQQRVENTPKREQELFSLKRDYQNVQELYNSMLARKLEANVAVNMEKQQKGEQFVVIDPAVRPNKPVSPDMKKLFGIILVVGLGLGGGIIFLIDFMDSSVSKPEDVERRLGIPLLAAIPRVNQPKAILFRLINQAASFVGVLVSLGLLACFAAVSILSYAPAISLVSRYMEKIL